jgi:hypothetical protein
MNDVSNEQTDRHALTEADLALVVGGGDGGPGSPGDNNGNK